MEERTRADSELTQRQREVLRLLAKGHTNLEIAERLGISLDGAKWHVSELLNKFSVDSREELVECWTAGQRPAARLRRLLAAVPVLSFPKAALAFSGLMAGAAGVAAVVWVASAGARNRPRRMFRSPASTEGKP